MFCLSHVFREVLVFWCSVWWWTAAGSFDFAIKPQLVSRLCCQISGFAMLAHACHSSVCQDASVCPNVVCPFFRKGLRYSTVLVSLSTGILDYVTVERSSMFVLCMSTAITQIVFDMCWLHQGIVYLVESALLQVLIMQLLQVLIMQPDVNWPMIALLCFAYWSTLD